MSGFRTEADASVSAAATMTTAMDEEELSERRCGSLLLCAMTSSVGQGRLVAAWRDEEESAVAQHVP